MNIIEMSQFREIRCTPIVSFVDIQIETAPTSHVFTPCELQHCFQNCFWLLEYARSMKLPIAHFRTVRKNLIGNIGPEFSSWIDKLRPRRNEMVFERPLPSCYSNAAFCKFFDKIEKPTIILAGLTGEEACLSTAIDAYHRNHTLLFVRNASASRALGNLTKAETHDVVSRLINIYANIVNCGDVARQFK